VTDRKEARGRDGPGGPGGDVDEDEWDEEPETEPRGARR